ncbi:MAG: glycine cleavage system protein GcvH [Erysipelotrichaceae bacterium]|nr:glycine cleavage system protein GcvH [Erysipelotrichaceae bacterium]
MLKYPEEFKYSKTHEWVKEEDGVYVIGISDYAQDSLGDIVFVNLPEEGDSVTKGESFADVESVKAVSDVYAPVSGTIVAVNEELLDDPAKVNEDAFAAWMIKVADVTECDDLLDAADYQKLCEEEG